MDNKTEKEGVVSKIILYISFWAFGVLLFYGLSFLVLPKIEMSFSWQEVLVFCIVAGFIWSNIGHYLTRKDEKIAKVKNDIHDAVKKVVELSMKEETENKSKTKT